MNLRNRLMCLTSLVLANFGHGQNIVKSLKNQSWQFRKMGDSTWMSATVPGTVHTDLMAHELIPDPFYESNEALVQWIENEDWEYITTFELSEELLKNQHCELVLSEVDTYAKIYINGILVVTADNMFRTWRPEIIPFLKPGKNTLYIHFESAKKKAQKEALSLQYELPGKDRIFTRKAQYQYGWDWGPRLVTFGIGKSIDLKFWNVAKINALTYTQAIVNDSVVELTFRWTLQAHATKTLCHLQISIPDSALGQSQKSLVLTDLDSVYTSTFRLKNPKKWWCNGLGSSYLYPFTFRLSQGKNNLDSKTISIGIRTIELVQTEDSIGRSFYFKLNGVPVFIKGANYIPPDNFMTRATKKTYQSIVKNAVDANMNMLRVWGGGVYADDKFYEECDKNGILVWQDFMFACALYPSNNEFNETVKHEVIDQINRLQHHPCIALWCGNNEIVEGWHNWGWQKEFKYTARDTSEIFNNYTRFFEHLLPNLIAQYDPSRLNNYWPSSPSIGWGRKESLLRGDLHYWGVWWGMEPFDVYKQKTGRFVSEYGFQGMPNLSTFKKIAQNTDLNLKSQTVLSHQKHPTGYQTINTYMQRDYKVPATLESYIYVSQILQAHAMKIAIEAHRRAKPICMGTLYWQLNDCWPVSSWSTVDFYSNWKASHYQVKRSYAQTILSFNETDTTVELYYCTDALSPKNDTLRIKILNFDGTVHWQEKVFIPLKPSSSEKVYSLKKSVFGKFALEMTLLTACLTSDAIKAVFYFKTPKDLKLSKPEFSITPLSSTSFKLSSRVLVKNVALSIKNYDLRFSDNYFDLLPGEAKIIRVQSPSIKINFKTQLEIKSLYDVN